LSGKSFETLFLLARLGAAAALTLSVAGTLAPGSSLPQLLPSDLLLHAIGFGVPTMLACFAAGGRAGRIEAIALIAIAGFIGELAQGFVPGRTVSGTDLVANGVGIGCGAWLGWLARTVLLQMTKLLIAPGAQS
jgi:VanZ family protein